MGTFCFSCSPRQHPIVGSSADPTGRTVAITWTSTMPGGQGDDDVWLLYSNDGGDTWTQADPRERQHRRRRASSSRGSPSTRTGACTSPGPTCATAGRTRPGTRARPIRPRASSRTIQVTDGHGSGNTDFLGDYKGIVVQGPDVLVVWQDTRRDSGDIYFSRAAGAAGP